MISPSTFLVAQVSEVQPESRTLNVKVVGSDRDIIGVCVVNTAGNYALPQEKDFVLILSTAAVSYCIGVVQLDYEGKIERKKIKDVNGQYVRADIVDAGGINIGNITNRTKLTIDNNGDFSFWSSLVAGLRFESLRQILTLSAGTLNTLAGTVSSAMGNVFRVLPGTGNTPIQAVPPIDSTGIPGFAAVEVFFDLLYLTKRLVRFHLGHILNSKGVPEMSSLPFVKPLRALLEVCTGGVTISSFKMDEGGNIEIGTTLGNIVIDSSAVSDCIHIGGSALTTTQHAVLGELLIAWLNTHTHPSSWGPTGPASAGPTGAVPSTVLSTKVKIGS